MGNHNLLKGNFKIYRPVLMKPSGYSQNMVYDVPFKGEHYSPVKGGCWSTHEEGMKKQLKLTEFLVQDPTFIINYFMRITL